MTLYIDLSLMAHFLIYIISLKYLFIFFKPQKIKIFTLILINTLTLLPLIVNEHQIFITLSIFIMSICILYKGKFIQQLILFMTIYYTFSIFFFAISDSFILYHGLIAVKSLNQIYLILLAPITLLFVYFTSRFINLFYKLNDLRQEVIIIYDHKRIKLKGYLDTGNTLLVDNLPVVFMAKNSWPFISKNQRTITYATASAIHTNEAFLSKISYRLYNKVYVKDVLISLVDKEEFNGCHCLMNVWLIK